MSISMLKSGTRADLRTPCQAKLTQVGDASRGNIITAFVPVWGFSKFDHSSTYGSIAYQQTWPFVYRQMVEQWTQSNGVSKTSTTTFSNYWDLWMQNTTSGGSPGVNFINTTTCTDTVLTVTYWVDAGHTITGTYTATLSNLYDPLDATTGWAAKVTQANSILANYNFTDIPSTYNLYTGSTWPPPGTSITNPNTFILVPVSYAPGWATMPGPLSAFPVNRGIHASSNWFGYVCISGSAGTGSLNHYDITDLDPFALSIHDYVTYSGIISGIDSRVAGIGCSKSQWRLLGKTYNTFVNSNDHLTIYSQSLDVNPTTGVPTMGAITKAVLPSSLPNPLPIGQYVEFYPADAKNNANLSITGTDFGLLSFRSVNA